MDVIHLAISAAIGLCTAGVAWGTIRAEMRALSKWQEKHDTSDNDRFEATNNRIDALMSRHLG